MSRATWFAMLCAVSAHATALASPRSDPTVGRAVFTGAATPNATSIDLNPAAIGLGARSEIYMAAVGLLDRWSIDLASSPDSITDYTFSPGGTLAAIWHTSTEGRITLGFQLGRTSPGERWLEHESLRYHTLGGYHRTVSPLTVAASLRVSSRFYVGVSIGTQSSYLKLRYARDTALEAARDPDRGITSDCGGEPCGIGHAAAAERYEVDIKSGLFTTAIIAVNLGVAVRLARDVWLGASYHAPPGLAIQNELTGTMAVHRAPRDGGEQLNGAATVYISQPASVDLALRARILPALDLHVAARWEDLSRFQSYDVRGYGSTLPPSGIPEWQPRPRGFHDAFAAWAGVEQVERDVPVIFGARAGIERSALPDSQTSPLTMSPTSLTLDAGVQYRISEQLVVQATYGLAYFTSIDVQDSAFDPEARLACVDSGFDYSTPACAAVRSGYAIPSAAGSYGRIEHAIRLAVRFER